MGEKMPWYVRFSDYRFLTLTKKFEQILSLIIILVMAVEACLFYMFVYMFVPRITYEEVYDMQFYNYIEDKLKEVADIVIEEGKSINLDKIPDTVLEYDIKYTEQGIKFNYVLDNEKIISEYYSKTGEMPNKSDSEKEMEMNIKISKDFQMISETSTLSAVPTYAEYNRSEPLDGILISIVFGLFSVLAIYFVLRLFDIATSVWRRNHAN